MYICKTCGAEDCKLWRESECSHIELICWECLEKKGHKITYGEDDGSDQVYDSEIEPTSYVPAVPNLDGDFWGYTSVPEWWCEWWKTLPDKKSYCKYCLGKKIIFFRKQKVSYNDPIGKEYECVFCRGTGLR